MEDLIEYLQPWEMHGFAYMSLLARGIFSHPNLDCFSSKSPCLCDDIEASSNT